MRRHYATILSSVCLMTEEELQYLMGHDIRNADIRHSDLLDTDWLIQMYNKLNRRHIFTEFQSDLANFSFSLIGFPGIQFSRTGLSSSWGTHLTSAEFAASAISMM